MPNSLVTGGAGFIGAHVSSELIKMSHQVVVLDDLSGGVVPYIANSVNVEAAYGECLILEPIRNSS